MEKKIFDMPEVQVVMFAEADILTNSPLITVDTNEFKEYEW